MIQRVQTLFLLGASGLLFSLFFSKFTYTQDTVVKFVEYIPFLVFTIATFLLSFIPIFLYKNRVLQMRICIYNMIILLAYQGWVGYKFMDKIDGSVYTVSAVFPIVAAILVFLAFRFIGKDEAYVQSMNSLRSIQRKIRK